MFSPFSDGHYKMQIGENKYWTFYQTGTISPELFERISMWSEFNEGIISEILTNTEPFNAF